MSLLEALAPEMEMAISLLHAKLENRVVVFRLPRSFGTVCPEAEAEGGEGSLE